MSNPNQLNTKPNAVFFDLDGTLLDTAPDLAAAINTLLAQRGKPPLKSNNFRQHIHGGSKTMLSAGFNIDENHPEFTEIKQAFLSIYAEHLAEETKFFPGMAKLLDLLDLEQQPWGIVTNKPLWLTNPLLNSFKLKSRACCIIAGDSLAKAKPHPEPLLKACELAKVAPQQAIYIGDTEGDIIAAKRAAMSSIAVSYGYHPRHSNPAEWQADYLAHCAQDILEIIL